MACDLETTQAAACASGIGKIENPIDLLRLIAQLSCEIADAGTGGSPGGPANSVQFNNAGAFGGSADLVFNDVTNVLALTGSQTIAVGVNTTALAVSGYSLTGANAQSAISITGTWNTTGAPNAVNIDITNTASNAAAGLLRVAKNGQAVFLVRGNGAGGTTFGPSETSGDGGFRGNGALIETARMDNGGAAPFGCLSLRFDGNTDAVLMRQAAGILEINNNTLGQFRDLEVRNILTNNAGAAFSTNTTLTNNAGGGGGTLGNAPTAGDPTKWIGIDDNGTTRFIPTWT